MRKHTLLFSCLVLGGTLFALVGFYFGFWRGGNVGSAEVSRQVVISEGSQTVVAPLPKPTLPNPKSDPASTTPQKVNPIEPTAVLEAENDQLGYAAQSPQGSMVLGAGAKVLQLPELETFVVYWLPENAKADRFLVLLHDANETAYDEIGAEIAAAKANGYGLLAIQWHTKSTDTYQSAAAMYRGISSVFDWLDQSDVRPKTLALAGLGQGATVSFELLSFDRSNRRFFSGVAGFSGGIPNDAIVAPKRSARPDPFLVSLIVGQVKADLYSGLRFYLYCGRLDEEWGVKMCEQVNYAQSLAIKYGAKADALVTSETLGHRGVRTDPMLYQGFIDWFLSL